MKKLIYTFLFAMLPLLAAAQVEKSVEVTKEYVPSVASATKLSIQPVMTDTAVLRPDIDYSITPLAMATRLTTQPIRPVTVTYWEFNRPRPFYLKLGAGWPLNSVAEVYASTQNPGTGYLMGYIHHRGRFADIRNTFGVKANSTRMDNRIGIAAGKYIGRHVFEGEVYYDNRLYHRYGGVMLPEETSPSVDYGETGVAVRFGDDFTDLRRVNFNIGLRGTLFDDLSDRPERAGRVRQTHLGAEAALARRWSGHTFRLHARYEHDDGARAVADYGQDMVMAGLRYGYEGGLVSFEAGADYYFDKIRGAQWWPESEFLLADDKVASTHTGHYVLPALRLRFDLRRAFAPFAEVDGGLRQNGPRTLARLNPYVVPDVWTNYSLVADIAGGGASWTGKSTVDYRFRAGIGGSLWSGKFVYRVFGEYALVKNHLFWALDLSVRGSMGSYAFRPMQGELKQGTVGGELEYRPSSRWLLDAEAYGYFYKDNVPVENALPAFRAQAGVRYTARKFSFGVKVAMQGERKWTYYKPYMEWQYVPTEGLTLPFVVDLSADIEWRVTPGVALFGEAGNLADRKLYDYPFYRDYGVHFTAGVKLEF